MTVDAFGNDSSGGLTDARGPCNVYRRKFFFLPFLPLASVVRVRYPRRNLLGTLDAGNVDLQSIDAGNDEIVVFSRGRVLEFAA